MATRNNRKKSLTSPRSKNKEDAGIRTIDEARNEIARLQEQIRLLQIENEQLKKSARADNERSRVSVARVILPSTPVTPRNGKITGKGCTCKGNCSRRHCGCVRNDKSCGEHCKCKSSVCQNQEKDKENAAGSSSDNSVNSIDQEKDVKSLINTSELSESFNPMKPLRQLLRSPFGNISNPVPTRLSDTIVSSFEVRVDEKFIPIPEDIDKPEVDWNEHQAQLVRCTFCKRTFFPHRIKKHEASCKRI